MSIPLTGTSSFIRALLVIAIFLCGAWVSRAAAEDVPSEPLPPWTEIIRANHERFAHVDSDQAAKDVFVNAVGRAAGLQDVAGTLAVQGLSTKLAKDLMVPQITAAVQRLMASLVAWRLADSMMQSVAGTIARTDIAISPGQASWLLTTGAVPSFNEAMKLWDAGDTSAAAAASLGSTAQEAARRAMEEWWFLKTWKDRVRSIRGQARLCGTWHWVIHNHQRHHEEQKLSLIFPPPGTDGAHIPGLMETVILGDVVYLRWEKDGKVQEDSLLFSKEGQRLEGTFVNSQGGWGSITGKRTATCTR